MALQGVSSNGARLSLNPSGMSGDFEHAGGIQSALDALVGAEGRPHELSYLVGLARPLEPVTGPFRHLPTVARLPFRNAPP